MLWQERCWAYKYILVSTYILYLQQFKITRSSTLLYINIYWNNMADKLSFPVLSYLSRLESKISWFLMKPKHKIFNFIKLGVE